MKFTNTKDTPVFIASKLTIILQSALRYIDKLQGTPLTSPLLKGKIMAVDSEIERWTKNIWKMEETEKTIAIYNRIVKYKKYVSKAEQKSIKDKIQRKYSCINEVSMSIETMCDMFETQYDIADQIEKLSDSDKDAFGYDYKLLLEKYNLIEE